MPAKLDITEVKNHLHIDKHAHTLSIEDGTELVIQQVENIVEITREEIGLITVAEQGPRGVDGYQGVDGPPGPIGPQGIQGPPGEDGVDGDLFYMHPQIAASTTWNVVHNMGKYPSVTVIDSGGTYVIGEVDYISPNELNIIFTTAFSGEAYLN